MGQVYFVTTLFTAILGLIVGLLWSLALTISIKDGMLYGAIIGAVLGLLIAATRVQKDKPDSEKFRMETQKSAALPVVLFLLGVVGALVTWIVRAIF